MISPSAVEAIEASDTDELLRVVDGLCEARDWHGLMELKDRCHEAVTRGNPTTTPHSFRRNSHTTDRIAPSWMKIS